jgi:hypothetical protein
MFAVDALSAQFHGKSRPKSNRLLGQLQLYILILWFHWRIVFMIIILNGLPNNQARQAENGINAQKHQIFSFLAKTPCKIFNY